MMQTIRFYKELQIAILLFVCLMFDALSAQNSASNFHKDIVVISNGELIIGEKNVVKLMNTHYKTNGEEVNYSTQFSIPVFEVLDYEIGMSQTNNDKEFAHIIVWAKSNNESKKLVEVIYENNSASTVPEELAEARKKWIELCNLNNASALVGQLYTEDAIYYNRGRVIQGRQGIAKEYSYMNSPSYSLQLLPKHIVRVSDAVIYEIGMCKGSYNLPYILVWKKQSNNNWQIYFDSNY